MIHISGSARRVFTFPAQLPMAYAYYSDVGRVLGYLPHLVLVRSFSYDQFRMLYSTIELGVYHIRIYCDLQTMLEANGAKVIRIKPLRGMPPVRTQSGVNHSTAQGTYSSTSVFLPSGDHTRIEYTMALEAKLPAPVGLRLMPGSVVDSIASNIAHARIHEIVNGFIERSLDAFPHWLAEMEQPRYRRARAA